MRKLVLLFILSLVLVIWYQNYLLRSYNIDAGPNVVINEWRKEVDGRLRQNKEDDTRNSTISKKSMKQMWDSWGERMFGTDNKQVSGKNS